MKDCTKLAAWTALTAHAQKASSLRIADLFGDDAQRFDKLSLRLPGLLADFSKNLVTDETLELLFALLKASNYEPLKKQMLAGDKINLTDGRAVLHTALRKPLPMPEVHEVLERAYQLSDDIRSGSWLGHGGKPITDIVHIGIGGSNLGPRLAVEALAKYHHPKLACHFVANVEASDLDRTLAKIDPETTLFIIASKSFTTVEVMQNATIARDWLLAHFKGDQKAVARHFVAASTNAEAVEAFGIAPENMFPFRDWVGGRWSVWSAIGLCVMIMAGRDSFRDFLAGAYAVDDHFINAPPEQNIPVIMGLIGIWYRNFLNLPTYAVAPYHSGLARMPAWLQQIDMESNGKCVTREGDAVHAPTGPMVFGEPGTDSQHSFFQWLHQGTDIVPVDFIAAVRTDYGTKPQQDMLLANCLAQSEALMLGKKDALPHKNFPGNRPSTTLLVDALTPVSLGMLMALYEHKIFVQGAIWNINSYDQYGVELGKVLAQALGDELAAGKPGAHDASTVGLMNYIINAP